MKEKKKMTKEEVQKLIIDYPQDFKEVSREEFNEYLNTLDKLCHEMIRCSWSSVTDSWYYYSKRLAEKIESYGENIYEYYWCGILKDYANDKNYYINTNFEKVFTTVFNE